jgi:hypothetical protein
MATGLSANDFGAPKNAADFGASSASPQVAPPENNGLSASDFGAPKQASDFGSSATPESKVPTNHDFDSYFRSASQKYGIDESILRSVAAQETNFGRGSNYDPKTGRDKDGNQGRGIMQLDPSHFGNKPTGDQLAVLNKVSTDPEFAINYAAQMLSDNIKANGGDVHKGVQAYNGTGPAAEQYADTVMSRAGRLDDPDYRPAVVRSIDKNVKKFNRAINHGDSAGQASAKTDAGRPLQRFEAGLQNNLQWAQDHPIDAFVDVTGAPSRGLGGFEEAAPYHRTIQGALHEAWQDVMHPTDKNVDKATNGPRDTVNGFAHRHGINADILPTHEDVDRAAEKFGPLAPTVKVVGKTASDILSQALSGGFTSVEGLGLKGIAKAFEIAGQAASEIPQAKAATDALGEIFRVRNDLHKAGFTQTGKQMRLAIENVALNNAQHQAEKDILASNDGKKSAQRMLEYAYNHGDKQTSADAAKMLGKAVNPNASGAMSVKNLQKAVQNIQNQSQAKRGELFAQLRNMVVKKEVNTNTLKHLASNPEYFKGNAAAIKDLGTSDRSNMAAKSIDDFSEHSWFRWLGNLGKRSISWNPAAHGIKNVGTLTYLAGGEDAVRHGIGYMTKYAKTGIPSALKDRLENMGATAHYMDKATSNWAKASNAALEHMELSWRAGLLKTLDKKYGPSKNAQDELKKGAMILHKLGDYRNLSGFVKLMQGLGAPFAIFREGIVPARVAEAAIHNPERLMRVLRAKEDYQNNREDRKKNRYVMGDPTDDALESGLRPKTYAAKSLGIAGELMPRSSDKDKGVVDQVISRADEYLPGISSAADLARIATGNFVHNEISSPLNRVFQAMHSLILGGRNEDLPKPKAEQKKAKSTRKYMGT